VITVKKKFYITTAIDYVNARPHLGHAYEKIVSDVIARWHRLRGEDVFFLTGTDENAQKNQQAAKKSGIPVKKFVEQNSNRFEELCRKLNISYDDFIRTTKPGHQKISQEIFRKVYEKGDIYMDDYEGLYCEGCEAYITEKELVKGKCPEHGTKPMQLGEKSFFFRMSRYQKRVKGLLSKPGFVFPESRRIEMLNRIKEEGLKDLCVSRRKKDLHGWGIDLPRLGEKKSNEYNIGGDSKIYVWFDALINYVSALGYPRGVKFRRFWPADTHMIGKGINWFHSVIWPSMLISAGIELPKRVVVHGYITVDGKKLSKSLGNAIDPTELAKRYPVDALRYFLVREIPFGEDGDFSEEALKARINGELVADLGNLVSRVLALAEKHGGPFKGKPELEKELDFKGIEKKFKNLELHHALDGVWSFVRACNKYINGKEPWKLEGKELSSVLYNLLEGVRVISILINPFMPETSGRIAKQLGVKPGTFRDLRFGTFRGKPRKGEHLFKKID
jgi:methionyl-tRNA synthetase